MRRGHIAKFLVSPELLRELFHMPETARIENVHLGADGQFEFYIESPDVPEVEVTEGAAWPTVRPLLHCEMAGDSRLPRWDWNL